MSIDDFSRRCEDVARDSLECTVVVDKVYVGAYIGSGATQNDIALTPDGARALAEWLEGAALIAEQAHA